MNKIDKLIQDLCPDGVDFKELWQVTTWDKRFNTVANWKQPKIIKYPYLLASELKSLIIDNGDIKLLTTSDSDLWTTDELAGDKVSKGEIIAIPGGGNPNVQYFSGKFLTSDNRIATANDTRILNNKFLYYYLKNQTELLGRFYRGAGIKHPNMAKVLDFKIPIPPLKVQEEIVEILDKFTALETALETELKKRKLQYEYYLNDFYSFKNLDSVEWKTFGEIGSFIRGNGVQKKDFIDSGIGCIHYGQIYTHYGTHTASTKTFVSSEVALKAKKAKPGNLIIATTSENDKDLCKAVAWLGNEEIAISNDALIFQHFENPKFIAYYLQTSIFYNQIIKHITGVKVRRISTSNLSKLKIPIPPLKVQEEIVEILDKFDTYVNDLRIGLPAEIKKRNQQYEYYRNELLTFKELKNE